RSFVVSDRTFELDDVPSWGSHLDLAAASLDGFVGNIPKGALTPSSPGWGCDSGKDAVWKSPVGDLLTVPACVPAADGSGPYTTSPVSWLPTIMDRADAAGLSWRLYAGFSGWKWDTGYTWATCPSFSDCLYSAQANAMQPAN